ncbi:hypothetical protein Ahy_B01g053155 isoform B [Arachis hypogaea]|nr:hypothetical protein Ahy_B01g053155 isoform B [Arachis hypogaea]
MWGNPQGVAVTDIGRKKLLFSFKDIKKGLQIVRNGPWNIRGNLINLQLWSERESVFDVNHDYMEFWIQVHGLPLDYMNKEIAIKVGDMMGIVAEVENPLVDGILRRSFLRIKVGINITKALRTGFWLSREEMPKTWVFFKYERLPDCYCFKCGIIGHEKKNCSKPTAMACWDPTKPKYSAGLGVNPVRPLSAMEEGSSWKSGWRNEGEVNPAHEQQHNNKESDEKQETEESAIRAEQCPQQGLEEEGFLENKMMREIEMVEVGVQADNVQKIPDFQGYEEEQREIWAAYQLKNLEELRDEQAARAVNKQNQEENILREVRRGSKVGPSYADRPNKIEAYAENGGRKEYQATNQPKGKEVVIEGYGLERSQEDSVNMPQQNPREFRGQNIEKKNEEGRDEAQIKYKSPKHTTTREALRIIMGEELQTKELSNQRITGKGKDLISIEVQPKWHWKYREPVREKIGATDYKQKENQGTGEEAAYYVELASDEENGEGATKENIKEIARWEI